MLKPFHVSLYRNQKWDCCFSRHKIVIFCPCSPPLKQIPTNQLDFVPVWSSSARRKKRLFFGPVPPKACSRRKQRVPEGSRKTRGERGACTEGRYVTFAPVNIGDGHTWGGVCTRCTCLVHPTNTCTEG